jgi:hyaluronan synthase
MNPRVKIQQTTWLPLALFAAVTALAAWRLSGTIALYGGALMAYLAAKVLLSVLPTPATHGATPDLRVGVIVTVYNEDPETLRRCLESIRSQTRRPYRVTVVDDASSTPVLESWSGWPATFTLLTAPTNRGKRQALAAGFRSMRDVDVYLCVDSDVILDPDALRQGVRAFAGENVVAVTGVALAANYRKSLFTRLVDLRYVNSFLGERAAYSRLGSVLCVSGAIAFWSAHVVHQHLEEFLEQEFLGEKQTTGDDRHLTNLHQAHGRVVLARTAVAVTVVPERIGHFLRQQARWGRSFWRESLWALQHLSPRQGAWWLSGLEMVATAGFGSGLLVALVVDPILTGTLSLGSYLEWICIGAWARSVHAFAVHRGDRWWVDAVIGFAAAPLYGLLNLLVVMPVRVWSLLTLNRTTWGTRANVEIGAPPPAALASLDTLLGASR